MTQHSEPDFDVTRRFAGVVRLYGDAAAERFRSAHAVVVGLGGVGSWAAEALARSCVGQLTLVDLDHVAESNTNRQIHALGDAYGKAKVDAMAERLVAINPCAAFARWTSSPPSKMRRRWWPGRTSCSTASIRSLRRPR